MKELDNLNDYKIQLIGYRNESMNICFLYGKIVSEIEFDFVYNSKTYVSVVNFEIETENSKEGFQYGKSVNRIFAYNKLADELYSNYETGDFVKIIGCIENNKIRILEI